METQRMIRGLGITLAVGALTCLAQDLAVKTIVAEGLTAPTAIASPRDGSGRLFAAEHGGTVSAFLPGEPVKEVLDIKDRVWQRDRFCCDERGLLAITFPPGSGPKDHVFLSYVTKDSHVVVSRFSIDPTSGVIDPGSETVLVSLLHTDENHFASALAFHPIDGLLYWSTGDGSSGNAVAHTQNPADPLGKILRFDPYSDQPGKYEIYAMGFRNPWRMSFDSATGDLYIGDVGENTFEEVNFVPNGTPAGKLNFGWGIMEGFFCYEFSPCSTDGLTLPIVAFDHEQGCSVTAGETYRGSKVPDWQGKFFYADFCMGTIWETHREGSDWVVNKMIDRPDHALSAFGKDEEGEIYFTDYVKGLILRLDPPAKEDDSSGSPDNASRRRRSVRR